MPLRLVFMGTPEFAATTFAALLARQHSVSAVYTQPPRPAGRGLTAVPSPVAVAANAAGIPVHTPLTLRTAEAVDELGAYRPDAVIVVAYGLILPPAILDVPRFGCLNLHASLLPRWRGAAPIQRAIMAGDRASGVCVMRMEEGLDTGPVALCERVAIGPDMTASELHDALAHSGAALMADAIDRLERGDLTFSAQLAAGVTYAHKIKKEEARIAWNRPRADVHNHIRGLSPFPGAWFEAPDGSRVKVLRSTSGEGAGAPGAVLDDRLTIGCRDGAVRLLTLQRAGRRPMDADEFLRGMHLRPGSVLS